MRAGQWELCGVVIERRSCPSGCRVTERTIRREPARYMRRVRRSVEVDLMAGIAVSRRRVVVVIGVALRALRRGVLTGQRPFRVERVIEFCIVPAGCRMAHSAVAG